MRRFYERGDFQERIFFKEKKEKEIQEKLSSLILELAGELKELRVPIDESGRISMEAFDKIYSKEIIKKDKEKIENLKKEWEEKESQEKEKRKEGEKFEILKTIIFHKFLKKEFITLRTSLYDDIFNKADNLMIEKESGNPICSFDEVAGTSEALLGAKKTKILSRNIEGGAHLKYGIFYQKEEVRLGNLERIPIFYLYYPREELKRSLEALTPFEEKSDYEQKIFSFFISLLKEQIKFLYLKILPKDLEEKIGKFERSLLKFEK